jgi:hypothetical protein
LGSGNPCKYRGLLADDRNTIFAWAEAFDELTAADLRNACGKK